MAERSAHQKIRMNTAQIPGILNSSVAKRKNLPQKIMWGMVDDAGDGSPRVDASKLADHRDLREGGSGRIPTSIPR